MANSLKAIVGLEECLRGLDALADERNPIAQAMGAAMGVVVRDEAIARAPELKPGHEGWDNQQRGTLKNAMYVAFDGRRSILNQGYIVYGVSWNAKKAPHGHLVEFGHWMAYQWEIKEGKYYTPLYGSHRVDGRKRNKGLPIPGGGFYVNVKPFLAPAFDSKVGQLAGIAAEAGAKRFAQMRQK